MAVSATSICNMALGRLGAKRITSYDDDTETSVEAIQCRLYYEPTRDALLRSHLWRFARGRAELSANATDPAFEWDYAYDLPVDFMRFVSIYEDNYTPGRKTLYSMSTEGTQILSNESEMEIRYIKKITDPGKFDPLFVEVLVLKLAMKMAIPLTGGESGNVIRRELYDELYGTPRQPGLMAQVRMVDMQEQNNIGRSDMGTWNNARRTVGDPAKSYS